MNNELLYRAAGIDNEAIRRLIEDQANFHINWHYDYLVRRELDNTGQAALTQKQQSLLKDEATRYYSASNQNFMQDMKDAGA